MDEKLLEAQKLHIRKSGSDKLDDEVKRLQRTVLADLERIGVDKSWLNPVDDPLIEEAVLDYTKAKYSINDQYDILMGCYDMTITKIKGTRKYKLPKPKAGDQ